MSSTFVSGLPGRGALQPAAAAVPVRQNARRGRRAPAPPLAAVWPRLLLLLLLRRLLCKAKKMCVSAFV